jgi:hypothetical protein
MKTLKKSLSLRAVETIEIFGHACEGRGSTRLMFWRGCRSLALVFAVFIALVVACSGATRSPKQRIVPHWARFEQAFLSTFAYTNPLQEASFRAVFTSPSGEIRSIDGFWDGGRTWRVRFCPDTPGQWTFTTYCSDQKNAGLDGQTGKFLCTAPVGDSVFQRHGPVRIARDHRHFEHADGTPFFWIADTVWSGACVSTPKDWQRYATIRASQSFNVALWCIAPENGREQERAVTGFYEKIGINPTSFQRLDAKLEILSREGILSAIAPVADIGAPATGKLLPEDQAALLFRYVIARWGADPVVWVVDARNGASSSDVDRWRRIGDLVFTNSFHAPTLLIGASAAPRDVLFDRPWVGAYGFETAGVSTRKPIGGEVTAIEPSSMTPTAQPHPVVLFAPRENGLANASKKRFNPDDVRHAVYENLFMAPPAGVTYSAQGVLDWDTTGQANGTDAGMPLWQKSSFMPGAKQMRTLAMLMHSIDFWRLRPQPQVVPAKSGQLPANVGVVAASTASKDLTLVYLPQPDPVDVYLEAMPASPLISWLEPRQGATSTAVAVVSGPTCQFPPPGTGDWVLLIRASKQ